MIDPAVFSLAYLLDLLMGDPEWLPHPVRMMGLAIDQGERVLRKICIAPWSEFVAGTLLTIFVAGGGAALAAGLVYQVEKWSPLAGKIVTVYLASTTLATRSLLTETHGVLKALGVGSLERARQQVSRIVGRDTDHLEEEEVVRAAIETVAESASDGIVAPMLFLAIGGLPAAFAYKAVNTLDSMIGHNDSRYRYFGKFAARMDDLANFVPARLTGLLITVAAFLWTRRGWIAWRTWIQDGAKHASPNAGHPEAAMAGALGVRLGGTNFYDGKPHKGPYLGTMRRPLDCKALRQSLLIAFTVSVSAFFSFLLFLVYFHGKQF